MSTADDGRGNSLQDLGGTLSINRQENTSDALREDIQNDNNQYDVAQKDTKNGVQEGTQKDPRNDDIQNLSQGDIQKGGNLNSMRNGDRNIADPPLRDGTSEGTGLNLPDGRHESQLSSNENQSPGETSYAAPDTAAHATNLDDFQPVKLNRSLTLAMRLKGEKWTMKRAARYIILVNNIVKTFTRNLKPYQYLCYKCKMLKLHQNKFIVSQHSTNPRDQAYDGLLSSSRSLDHGGSTSASATSQYSLGSLKKIRKDPRSSCPFCKLVVLSLEESFKSDIEKEIARCCEDSQLLRNERKKCIDETIPLKAEIEKCTDAIQGRLASVGQQISSPSRPFAQRELFTEAPMQGIRKNAAEGESSQKVLDTKYKIQKENYSKMLQKLEARIQEYDDKLEILDENLLEQQYLLADTSREKCYERFAEARCYASFQMDGREVTRDQEGNVIDSRPRTRRIQLKWSDEHLPTSYIILVAPESGAGYSSEQSHSWESSTSFLARNIGVANKNDARIRRWIDLCQKHHGQLCNRDPGAKFERMISKAFFGVIDVYEMRLRALEPGARYVALSYTWGQSVLYTTTLQNIRLHQEPGGLDQVWERLPKVIKDAIQLVRSLGERFLWIDSLCIVQKTTVSWNLNSAVMDLVYGNAFVTICAAEGEGAHTGLIALDPKRQVSQYVEECAEGLRLGVSHLAETYIGRSRWNTRGWTFQERLLSRRCIIFAGSRVFFQCRATAFSEDVNGEHESVGWSIDLVQAPLRMLVDIKTTAFAIYMECVRLYTRRDLGKSKDILAAFRGMSNLLGQEMGSPLHFGLPTSHFDIALLWEPISACARRVPGNVKEKEEFDDLVFPSWSWCGWRGSAFDYHKHTLAGCLPNVSQWLAEHTWIHWYIRDGEGDLRPVWTPLLRNYERENHTWTDSRWLGYGWYEGQMSDGYGRMVKKEYNFDGERGLKKDEFHRTLPEYPFGISKTESTTDASKLFRDQPYLQFWTWTANLRVTSRTATELSSSISSVSSNAGSIGEPNIASDGLVRCDIEDYCGDWCGTIVLESGWFEDHLKSHPDENAIFEFIAISEAKNFSEQELDKWTYYVPCEQDKAEWDLFYVLMVTRRGGICYRQGLGKVFKEAFGKSYLPGKDWKEIIMG